MQSAQPMPGSPVQIVAVEAWPLRVPLLHPMRLASETITVAETLLVRAVDAEGHEGWGEASSAPTMTGDLLPGMTMAVRRFLAPALMAKPLADLAEVQSRLGRAIRGNTGPKAATETALLDLLARRAGISLSCLLGTPQRSALPLIATVGEADPDATLAGVARAREAGFTHVKLKLGMGANPAADAQLVQRARAVVGDATHLSGDANMAWSANEALDFLRGLEPGALNYLEQPVRDDDLRGMACCVATGVCPICFDEGLHALADIVRHAEHRAADGVGLKAIKLGGQQAMIDADALARRHSLRTTLACKIAETSIGSAALAQVAALLPEVEWGVSVTHATLAEDVVSAPLRLEGGVLRVPQGEGIGIVPDLAALRRLSAA